MPTQEPCHRWWLLPRGTSAHPGTCLHSQLRVCGTFGGDPAEDGQLAAHGEGQQPGVSHWDCRAARCGAGRADSTVQPAAGTNLVLPESRSVSIRAPVARRSAGGSPSAQNGPGAASSVYEADGWALGCSGADALALGARETQDAGRTSSARSAPRAARFQGRFIQGGDSILCGWPGMSRLRSASPGGWHSTQARDRVGLTSASGPRRSPRPGDGYHEASKERSRPGSPPAAQASSFDDRACSHAGRPFALYPAVRSATWTHVATL